jgi:hypothetical protein
LSASNPRRLWAAARTTNKLSDLDTLVFRRVGMATAGRPGPVLALSIDTCRGALVFVGDMCTADAVLAGVVPAVQAVHGVGRVVSCGRSPAAPDVYEIRLGTNPFNQPKAAGSVQSALVISEVLHALEQHGVSVYATVNLSQTDRVCTARHATPRHATPRHATPRHAGRPAMLTAFFWPSILTRAQAPDTFLLAASSTSLAASSDKSAPPSYDDATRGQDKNHARA